MAGTQGRSGGANRKSLRSHQLAGTYRRDRHRGLGAQPGAPVLALEVPGHLTGAAKAFWEELAPQLQAAGLLTALDLPRLELLTVHLGHHRELYLRLNELLENARASGTPTDTSRVSRSLRQEADVIRSLSVGFGLDPADRERLHVRPIDPNNPWAAIADPFDEFINRKPKWSGVLP